MVKTTKQIETLVGVYEELLVKLSSLDDPTIHKILASWRLSLGQIQEFIDSRKVKPSLLASGLVQGIYDCLSIFSGIGESERSIACRILFETVENAMPGFFDSYRRKVDDIIKVGKVRSEQDWHLVRCRIDELEEQGELEQAKMLDSLLHEYERFV